jgi:pectin methylesterase-like acyl-CoA thioesterase
VEGASAYNYPNDGHTWNSDAFTTIQAALDTAVMSDTIVVGPGTYAPAVFHFGKDYITLRGVDPDAVFLDANGGTGLTILPASEWSSTSGGIKGVTVERLTIRNAMTGIEVNHGGSPGVPEGTVPT